MADEIDVTIANFAIGFFGEDDQIRSPDQDSKPARSVRAVWKLTRQFVRTKSNWSCGRRLSRLAARADSDPLYAVLGYARAFPLPLANFARLIRIVDPYDDSGALSDYKIVRGPKGREILCDYDAPLLIEWSEDVEDPALWSAEFTECFAMRLAWQVADRLSGDKQRKEQALGAYREALTANRNSDARQQPPQRWTDTDWGRVRSGSRGVRAPNT